MLKRVYLKKNEKLKKLIYGVFCIVFVSVLLGGCKKDDALSQASSLLTLSPDKGSLMDSKSLIVNKNLTLQDLFDEIVNSTLSVGDEEAIHIDYEWDASGELATITSVEVREPDFFILQDGSNREYIFEYDNGDSSWSKECNGKVSCGFLIRDCLDEGRSATISSNSVVYVPKFRAFYLLSQQ